MPEALPDDVSASFASDAAPLDAALRSDLPPTPPATDDHSDLEGELGHDFADVRYLLNALCHRSYVAEHPGLESNERLEFLGDAVLGLVVTDVLFERWPDVPEGTLAKARAAVVNAEFLAEASASLEIGSHIYLGKGEDASGGREKPSILADAMEAVIGAVYLDAGLDAARALVMSMVEHRLEAAVTGEGSKDFKTRLQELTAQRFGEVPAYTLRAHGPDHAKHFEANVTVAGTVAGRGSGRSKKQAEQAAAREAFASFAQDESASSAGNGPGRGRVGATEEESDA